MDALLAEARIQPYALAGLWAQDRVRTAAKSCNLEETPSPIILRQPVVSSPGTSGSEHLRGQGRIDGYSPVMALARQAADLSAAGTNLFHAILKLQRWSWRRRKRLSVKLEDALYQENRERAQTESKGRADLERKMQTAAEMKATLKERRLRQNAIQCPNGPSSAVLRRATSRSSQADEYAGPGRAGWGA
ncbi:hypothetical protein FZEAL_7815 [Fusarium zealandicum]|uniref:Uncharacterized protein n=1 Tax=Fusarium zealandicum TaxID=1053134 RepID=A0A8H4UF51_9HYPO|nr:hypothetical protein FZEAL_7815 [Fusarium zealandicum]